jgi:hypothetical protein
MTTKAASPGITPLHRVGLRLRLRTAFERRALDRRLLAGESPQASPELSRRAELLLDPGERHEIAEALRQTVSASLEPPHQPSSKVSLNRAEIEVARDDLLGLATALESETPAGPRGVIMARRLVTDLGSPLYSPCSEGALGRVASHARAALLLR